MADIKNLYFDGTSFRSKASLEKDPCRVATVGDVADLAAGAPSTVDGVPLTLGDRVLVWLQAATDQNGIYIVDVVGSGADGQWSRADDGPTGSVSQFIAGTTVYVQEGTLYRKVTFTITTTGTITIGTTPFVFEELSSGLIGGAFLIYHEDTLPAPNTVVNYRGWAPATCTLLAVRVYMQTVNTVGNYTIAIQNEATASSVLAAASFDMNTLVAATVTALSLTATLPDLDFVPLSKWTVTLTSDNPGFNGDGIYFELQFANAGSGAGQDLATTLGFGNVSGGSDIILTAGDQVQGQSGLGLASDVYLHAGTSTGGGAVDGGDVVLRPGDGNGGGVAGTVILRDGSGANDVTVSVTGPQKVEIGNGTNLVYDAVTGKLTVPGLIDPTGIVYEEASAPTTGPTEGATFVSDGTLGLIAGHLYFSGPSNTAPVDLTDPTLPLDTVLAAGNTSGGTNIVLTSGDEIQGQSGAALGGSVVVRGATPASGIANGGDVSLLPGAGLGGGTDGHILLWDSAGVNYAQLQVTGPRTLEIGTGVNLVYDGTTGNLTVPGIIDPTAVVFNKAAAPTTGVSEGGVFVSDGTGGLIDGHLYYVPPSDGIPVDIQSVGTLINFHEDVPPAPATSVTFTGWVPIAATLQAVRMYMQTVNTVGFYTVAVTNIGTGNTVLTGATYNMNILVANTVTSLVLTAVSDDLSFMALGKWTVTFTSDDPGFNGNGIYFELQFGAGASGISGQDLASTLVLGNATGGFNIITSFGDQIQGEEGANIGGPVVIRGGTAVSGVANGGDVQLRPGAGVGGGVDGQVIVRNALVASTVGLSAPAMGQLQIDVAGFGGLALLYSAITGKLSVPGLVMLDEAPLPATLAGEGAIFVSDGTGGLVAGDLYYVGPSDATPVDLSTVATDDYFTDVSISPGNTIIYRYFAPYDLVVVGIKVYALTAPVAATGTYLFSAAGNAVNLLSAANYDLELLVSDTLTSIPLAVIGNRYLSTGQKFEFTFASDSGDLTGAGLYLQLLYQPGVP